MSSVNLFTREISIKIVYYGPGLGGKTSSLQYIHRALKSDSRGQLVSLATGVDRTLYFDFVPVKLPRLRGYSIRVQLYTVPGQVHYESTRKLVLAGADGVVFVADSQPGRETANIESCEDLAAILAEQGTRLDALPHLFQWNKRDLPEALPVERLARALNRHGAPSFETVATSGRGVFEGLKVITTLVLDDLRRRGLWDAGGDAARSTGAAASTEPGHGDASATQRVEALSEAADAMALLEASSHGPLAAPLPQAQGPLATGLAGLLPLGPAREQVAAAEAELLRGDYAEAVRVAARAFAESSRAESTSMELAPVLHALLVGLGGRRYLRFCEAAARAEQGRCSAEDAQFAVFFLLDAHLER